MRLTAFILLTACITAGAKTGAQVVSLNLKDVPIEKVFTEIRNQTGYNFLFSSTELKAAGKVSVNVRSASIEQVLALCFKNKPFTYTIENNTIVVKQKPAPNKSNELSFLPPLIDVHGRIINEKGEPVIASIQVKGTGKGTTSDDHGEFNLHGVDDNATLIISAVNIETEQVKLNGRAELTIVTKIQIQSLDELVFKGYYSEKKLTSTGDVTKVKSDVIAKQPVTNVVEALEGRVPGMFIQQSEGIAGGAINVIIRGKNSIAQGNDPLYIIDGVPYAPGKLGSSFASQTIIQQGNPLSSLDPSSIESIEVLKDADAIAIYGSRGANGVVLITTKSGKAGKTKVDFNFYRGVGQIDHRLSLLNTQQYLQMRHEAFRNDGAVMTTSNARDILLWDTTRYTDWQKVLIGGTAKTIDAQTSISGGNASTQFLVGGAYHRQTTVFPGDFSYQKTSMHFSLNHGSTDQKFRMSFLGNYSAENNKLPYTDPTAAAMTLAPDAPPIYDSLGNYNWGPANGVFNNPIAQSLLPKFTMKTNNLIANLVLSYQIVQGLKIKTSFGYNRIAVDEKQNNPTASITPSFRSFVTSSADFSFNNVESFIVEPQAEYNKKIGRGRLSTVAGLTLQERNTEAQTLYATGFTNDAQLGSPAFASSVKILGYMNPQYHYQSAFARIGYNWEEKYLVNFTGRRDGSSRFGPGRQFADFGSAALGWVFSKEKFFKDHLSFLNLGKIRSSYGTVGNEPTGDYQFLDLWSPTSLPYQGTAGLYSNQLFNPDYRWEENKKFDIGLDLEFLQNKISLSFDYYKNRALNQLVGYPLAPTTGFTKIIYNLPAIVQNTGFELDLASTNVSSKNFSWTSSFNVTIPRNKLVAYPDIQLSSYANTYVVGQPFTLTKTFHYLMVDPATGIMQFEDVDKNGVISSPADLQASKQIAQNYYGGFDNSFQWKGFQFGIFFQFVKQTGRSFYESLPPGFMSNQADFVMGRWQKTGDVTAVQKFSQDFNSPVYNLYENIAYNYGDNRIVDASFIRLKNLSLSYWFPKSWIEKIKAQNARIYVQGQNLLTFTNYVGLDPETQATNNLPVLRMMTAGFQLTF